MTRPNVAAFADFGASAHFYEKRAPYSQRVVDSVMRHTQAAPGTTFVADVGAGTGNFTRMLAKGGLRGCAVEPDPAMRAEALRLRAAPSFEWIDGTAEATTLPARSVDWLCVSTSF